MSGYEVAKRLGKRKRCKDAVIVAVSGYGQEEDRHRTKAAGFDHHLVKPISYDELFTLLDPKPERSTCIVSFSQFTAQGLHDRIDHPLRPPMHTVCH